MLLHAHLPVNESRGNNPTCAVDRPYIDPVPHALPVPGEDGAPQSVSPLVFDVCIGLVLLGLLFIWWPILQGVRL
jgi:hypothetical protein